MWTVRRPSPRLIKFGIIAVAVVCAGIGTLFPQLPGAGVLSAAGEALKLLAGVP